MDFSSFHRVKLKQSLTRINQTAMEVSRISLTTFSLTTLFRWKNVKLISRLAIIITEGEEQMVTSQVSSQIIQAPVRVQERCRACLVTNSSIIRSLFSNATSSISQTIHTCSKQALSLWNRNLPMLCGHSRQRINLTLLTRRILSIIGDHHRWLRMSCTGPSGLWLLL